MRMQHSESEQIERKCQGFNDFLVLCYRNYTLKPKKRTHPVKYRHRRSGTTPGDTVAAAKCARCTCAPPAAACR